MSKNACAHTGVIRDNEALFCFYHPAQNWEDNQAPNDQASHDKPPNDESVNIVPVMRLPPSLLDFLEDRTTVEDSARI